MLAHMIYFSASRYNKRAYASFRSSQALERFSSSPSSEERAVSLKWARSIVELYGRDFFDRIVADLHTPTGQPDGVMPVSDDPVPLENGDYIIPVTWWSCWAWTSLTSW